MNVLEVDFEKNSRTFPCIYNFRQKADVSGFWEPQAAEKV